MAIMRMVVVVVVAMLACGGPGNACGEDGAFVPTVEQRSWWAYQPVVDPPVPDVTRRDWPHDDLDRFVLAELEARGLGASPSA